MSLVKLYPVALSRDAFAPFGEVIETDEADSYPINEGTCQRFHDLATIDVAEAGGRPLVNIFRAMGRRLPCSIEMMERHPLASQAFIPLHRRPYLVVVADAETTPAVEDLRAFLAGGGQGVNYRRGVWHHPLLALEQESDFLVIDRGGEGRNLEQVQLDPGCVLHALADKN